jgi:hypothetical protein
VNINNQITTQQQVPILLGSGAMPLICSPAAETLVIIFQQMRINHQKNSFAIFHNTTLYIRVLLYIISQTEAITAREFSRKWAFYANKMQLKAHAGFVLNETHFSDAVMQRRVFLSLLNLVLLCVNAATRVQYPTHNVAQFCHIWGW